MSAVLRNEKKIGRERARCVTIVPALLLALFTSSAFAFSFDTGNSDLEVRWDNTIRYNAGWRAEGVDSTFKNSPIYDETELAFEQGEMVLNRVDVLSELDVVYKGAHGFRVSAGGWYDEAYEGKTPAVNEDLGVPGNYSDGRFDDHTKRYHRGPSGEILDAFVFTNSYIGDSAVGLKAGSHTVYWGESLFTTFHGISYSQSPLDGLKASSSPGITAKEVFLPVNQVSGYFQVSPELTFAAQYYLEWEGNRLPEGGTYFGSADMLWVGPDQLVLANGFAIPRGNDVEPSDNAGNNFGLSARWSPLWLGGTAGLYYRKFDETQPWAAFVGADTTFYNAYAEDTEMYAASLATTIGTVGMGFELVYRDDTALNSTGPGPNGREGARGDTVHFLANGVYLMPRTPLWDGGTLQAELIYSHFLDVDTNEQVFKHEDYACDGLGQDKTDGCATDNVVLAQVGFTPEWPNAIPGGISLSMPTSLSYGVYGNGATLGGGNEGSYSWSIGIKADVRKQFNVALKYNDAHADYKTNPDGSFATGSGNAIQNDHGWVSLAVEGSF